MIGLSLQKGVDVLATPIFDQVKKDHEEAKSRARQTAVAELETLTKAQLVVRITELSVKVGIPTKATPRHSLQTLRDQALDLTHLAYGPLHIGGIT